MPEQDHYAVLGIEPDADPRAVALAYRRAARRTHPDLGGSAEAFAAVQEAWRVLGDPAERAGYDVPRDDWAVDSWGVAIDEQSADADGGARPGADPVDDHPTGTGDGTGRRRPDIGSPFAAGAIDLPDPEPRAPRLARMPRAASLDRALEAVLLLSGVGVVVILLAAGSRIEGVAYGAAAFVVLLAGYCLWADRVVGSRTPWPVALFSVGLAVAMVVGSVELASWEASAVLADLTVGLVALCGRLILAKRRASYGESRSRDAVRVGRSLAQRELAAEWNVLREALRTPVRPWSGCSSPGPSAGPGAARSSTRGPWARPPGSWTRTFVRGRGRCSTGPAKCSRRRLPAPRMPGSVC